MVTVINAGHFISGVSQSHIRAGEALAIPIYAIEREEIEL
jgi:hypothetical protein